MLKCLRDNWLACAFEVIVGIHLAGPSWVRLVGCVLDVSKSECLTQTRTDGVPLAHWKFSCFHFVFLDPSIVWIEPCTYLTLFSSYNMPADRTCWHVLGWPLFLVSHLSYRMYLNIHNVYVFLCHCCVWWVQKVFQHVLKIPIWVLCYPNGNDDIEYCLSLMSRPAVKQSLMLQVSILFG